MRRNKGGINRLGRETSAVLAALAEKLQRRLISLL